MKKGLLSLLVVALTVVGCQDYDDQFDSLNKEILALKTDLGTITGLQTSVTAISDEIKKLMAAGTATDDELAKVLTDIGLVKAAVDAIDVSGIDDVKTQTADLNTEIDDILTKLTKLAAATGGTYAGNINITNLVQLTAAEDIVDVTTDGPLMTVTGNVNITAGQTDLKLAANLLRIQAILNKLKVVSGNVTVTGVDSAMTADELLYITGSLDIVGKSTMGLPKLNTIDGAGNFNLYGVLSYPLLSSVAGGLTLSGNTASITTIDLSGLSVGIVKTSATSLTLPAAVSVKVGSLPVSVTLAKAISVEAHGISALLAATTIDAPKATAVTIKAGSFVAGALTINANLAAITLLAKTNAATAKINGASVIANTLTTISGATTISATTLEVTALKTVSADLTLTSIATAAFPALTALTASFTGAAVTAFTAPLLVATGLNAIDIKNVATGGGAISVKTLAASTTIVDQATISSLTVASQANDIVLGGMLKLSTLDYTGKLITGTLTIPSTMVSLTTLTLGSAGKLTTLTVSSTNMTALTTAGVILNATISNNTKLATLSFGHTHLDGELGTTVAITNNDKLVALDMSSLGKVKTVSLTGNASLTTITAPSTANKVTAGVGVTITVTGNDVTGTYSGTIAATETTPEVPWVATSAVITNLKAFVDGYSTTSSVTYSFDIDRTLNGNSTDGLINDAAFSASIDRPAGQLGTISATIQLAKF